MSAEKDNIGVASRSSVITGIAHLWVEDGGSYTDACRTLGERHATPPAEKNILLIEAQDTPCSSCLGVMTYDDPEDRAPEYVSPEDRETVAATANEPEPADSYTDVQPEEQHYAQPDSYAAMASPDVLAQSYVEQPAPVAGLGDFGVAQPQQQEFAPQEQPAGVFYPGD